MFKKLVSGADLYVVIILVSVLLLPAAGIWAVWLRGQIDTGREALRRARDKSDRGEMVVIGSLMKQRENMKDDTSAAARARDYQTFMQNQILAIREGTKVSDFKITQPRVNKVAAKKAVDTEVDIRWERDGKDYSVDRPFLNAVLYNIESQSPQWKLRALHVKNETLKDLVSAQKPPPPESADEWRVMAMTFASREPDTEVKRPGGR